MTLANAARNMKKTPKHLAPSLVEGGLISGPTLALVGGPNDQLTVAPLDKLRALLGKNKEGVIKGKTL